MKSYGEQYNRDAYIQICSGCYQFYYWTTDSPIYMYM